MARSVSLPCFRLRAIRLVVLGVSIIAAAIAFTPHGMFAPAIAADAAGPCSELLEAESLARLNAEVDAVVKCIDLLEDEAERASAVRDLLKKSATKDYAAMRYGASAALGKLAKPWKAGDDTHKADIDGIYQRIQQLDETIKDVGQMDVLDVPYVDSKDIQIVLRGKNPSTRAPTLAEYRQALEDALANAQGLFRTANAIPFNSKADIDRRIAAFARMRAFPATEYAVRSVILTAHANIIAMTAEIDDRKTRLEQALKNYEELLCSSEETPPSFEFCAAGSDGERPGYFWRPITGWRWLNDVVFERAVALILLGQKDEARAALEMLRVWQPVLDEKGVSGRVPFYVGLRPAVAANIGEFNPGFTDQIYVYQAVPGVSRPMQKYFATVDVAEFVLGKLDALNFDTLASRSDAAYLGEVDNLARLLAGMQRRDNVLVLGSFRSQTQAAKSRDTLAKQLSEFDGNPPELSVEQALRGWYRVQLKEPLTDDELPMKLKTVRGAGITDLFISRPTVP